MYTVYILKSISSEKFYVRSTGDLTDRIKRYNSGRSRATKSGSPWKVVYSKPFQTRSEAVQFEYYIKSQKSRSYIEQLIAGA